ncbi:E3 ubiquitin-protein ligase ZNF598-like [Diadema antillarum]|uniref:E3 ubiquitin-protein ligase ZNF598-like n=1 Tax=Diadema antillarum TaxID=105358 RepID=UPI003A898EF0
MSKTTDSLASTCVLCCQAIKIYAVGPCNHHICFKCSTKMRVICNQMYCAVCRADMPKAIFTNKVHLFDGIISHKYPHDRKYGIFFASSWIQEEYRKILAHKCNICGLKTPAFATFKQLQDHMRKEHERFSCNLCVEHIKVLSSERKFYSRKELAQHRRSGDRDDTSYRGHPLCEFCDERYFDNDELLRHLRKDHYFCHFCENDGVTNQYYGEYPDLADHFRSDHFLCEEDGCVHERFLGAFRTEIDLKAHKAKVHSGKMTKLQARQTRQVGIEINLPQRPREFTRDHRDRPYGGGGRGRDRNWREREDRDTARALEASLRDTFQRDEEDRDRRDRPNRRKQNDGRARHVPDEERQKQTAAAARPESPTEISLPQRETRRERRKKEDKENKDIALDLVTVPSASFINDTNSSNSYNNEKEPPDTDSFPALMEQTATVLQGAGNWNKGSVPDRAKDFPALGNGDGGVDLPLNVAASVSLYSSLTSNNPASIDIQPCSSEPTASESGVGEEEFPTLSSIASMLGGTVTQKKTKHKKKKNKPASDANLETEVKTTMGNSIPKETNVRTDTAEGQKTITSRSAHIATAPKVEATSSSQGMSSLLTMSSSLTPALPVTSSRPPPGFLPFASLAAAPPTAPATAPPPGFPALLGQSNIQSTNSNFIQPPNFKERNRELVQRIQELCVGDDELFAQFRQDSGSFRQDLITAKEYYQRCVQTLSKENFHSVFEELVTLLPDLKKQQELMAAHKEFTTPKAQPQKDKVLKISNTKPTASASAAKTGKKGSAWKSTSIKAGSSLCSVCSQVVSARDMAGHMNVHEDFPALSASRAKPTPMGTAPVAWGTGTWGRGK